MNFTKTILNGIKVWAESTFLSKSDAATDEDIVDVMLEAGLMPVVQDTDGGILVDSDGAILFI